MYGFEAVVFNGRRTARKALDTLEDHAPAYVWIDDVAILSRNKLGLSASTAPGRRTTATSARARAGA